MGHAVLALLQEEFLLVAVKNDCAGLWKLLTAPLEKKINSCYMTSSNEIILN